MKNNQILAALTGIFVLCALTTLCVFLKYRSSLNRLNQTQIQATYVKNVEGPTMQSLLNDTTEYSKKNAAVAPVLLALSNNMVNAARQLAAPKTGTK